MDLLTANSSVIQFTLINIVLGLSISITLSAGMLSLSNAGFMAIGAYTAAVIATQPGVPLMLATPLAMLLAVVLALPLGLIVLRLRDVYLAIATLGFGEILRIGFLNGDRIVRALSGNQSAVVFNGAEGITIPYRSPDLFLGLPTTAWPLVIFSALVLYVLVTIRRSHYGRVLAAIRLDEPTAATLGIDVYRYKIAAFIFGAAIAAAAGALSVPVIRVIDPRNYALARAVDVLAFAVLGGMTAPIGPVLGATLLTMLPEALRPLKEHSTVVNGLLIMAAIVYFPRGLAGLRLPRQRKQGVPVTGHG